jgi:CheY-like chemotaxis protein
MRKPLFTAALFWGAIALFSQNTSLDSLSKAVEKLSGQPRVTALNVLSSSWMTEGNADKAKASANEALTLAKKLDDVKGQALALDNLGAVFQMKLDYTRAMESYVEALKIRDKSGDKPGQALSRNHIGRIFFLMEDYTQAEENLVKALDIWKEINQPAGAAQANEYLADVFLAKKIYGKAQEHYRLAFELKLSTKDMTGASEIATHIGKISSDLGDYDSAITYYKTSLDLHRELNNISQIATDHSHIAEVLLAQEDYEGAMENNQQALDYRIQLKDTFSIAESEKNFGLIFLKMKDANTAKLHFQSSADLLESVTLVAGVPEVYRAVADGFFRVGDFEKAYRYHRAYAQTRTEVFGQEKAKALLDLTTKYESEFAAQEQKSRIELLEIENATSRKIRYFLFAVIALIGLLLSNVYLSFRRKQRDNRLLLAKNEEIQQQKDEIDDKNQELQQKNNSLDLLNKKLVDEIAERESLEKSSFARDRFLATMSNEMRNPLNVITGLTHLLLDAKPRHDQAEQLRNLQYAANDLVVFINDILDFSKIEAGKLGFEDREFNIGATLQDLSRNFGLMAERKGLLFHYDYDSKIPIQLMGDNARLHQIMTNLFSNTLHHTESGMVKTEINLQSLSNREAVVEITIEGTDGGTGRKILEEALKPWHDAEVEFDGYGSERLSLAITKRLIELQNGKLEVHTNPGTSTIFKILLPFKLIPNQHKQLTEADKKDYSHLAGNRILIVEDNKINQLVVAKMLRKIGIEVSTADNGIECLQVFERDQFDMVLMDIQMPEMDGYRATAEIRRHPNPAKREVPVIALTASAFLTEKEKAVLFGMNDHVGKPFSPEELLDKISACLRVYKSA